MKSQKKKITLLYHILSPNRKGIFYNNITVNLFELPKIYKSIFVNVKCFSIELFIQVITSKVLSLTLEALNNFFPLEHKTVIFIPSSVYWPNTASTITSLPNRRHLLAKSSQTESCWVEARGKVGSGIDAETGALLKAKITNYITTII